jgi:hypothetical protein
VPQATHISSIDFGKNGHDSGNDSGKNGEGIRARQRDCTIARSRENYRTNPIRSYPKSEIAGKNGNNLSHIIHRATCGKISGKISGKEAPKRHARHLELGTPKAALQAHSAYPATRSSSASRQHRQKSGKISGNVPATFRQRSGKEAPMQRTRQRPPSTARTRTTSPFSPLATRSSLVSRQRRQRRQDLRQDLRQPFRQRSRIP